MTRYIQGIEKNHKAVAKDRIFGVSNIAEQQHEEALWQVRASFLNAQSTRLKE